MADLSSCRACVDVCRACGLEHWRRPVRASPRLHKWDCALLPPFPGRDRGGGEGGATGEQGPGGAMAVDGHKHGRSHLPTSQGTSSLSCGVELRLPTATLSETSNKRGRCLSHPKPVRALTLPWIFVSPWCVLCPPAGPHAVRAAGPVVLPPSRRAHLPYPSSRLPLLPFSCSLLLFDGPFDGPLELAPPQPAPPTTTRTSPPTPPHPLAR